MTLTDDDRLWRDQNFPNLTDEELEKIIDTFGQNVESINDNDNDNDNKDNPNNKKENSTKVNKALDTIEKHTHKLFIDEYKTPYAVIPIEDHLEVFAINSKNFKNWCRLTVYKKDGINIDTQTLNDICSLLSARAQFDSKEHINLNLRIASKMNLNNNELEWIYDLTNKNWEFVKLTSTYWSIIKNEIIFRRYNNQQPQVYPLKEYEPDVFDKFMKLVNIKANDEETKLLLKCYIVSLFIPDIQKPVLMLHGSQGSAKSSLQELIKMLVDPSVVKTFTFPRDLPELIQQLSHNNIVYYDNVSLIKDWISDQLCRAVSGSGSSKRQLYTDDDDIIYSFKRCVGFNGINLGATKADLLDRGLIIELERIQEDRQIKPEDLLKEFEEIRPQLLGYIFEILVQVLNWKNNVNAPQLNLNKLPRMSEFAEYGEIISRCMGNSGKQFINAYYKNIMLQSREVLESSLVATMIIELMDTINDNNNNNNNKNWQGTPTQLLSSLESIAELLKINTKSRSYPKGANVLTRRLNEIRVNLRQVGIHIDFIHDGTKRIIIIRKEPLIPLEPLVDKNHAQKTLDSNDTTNGINDTNDIPNDIPLGKNPENHAQINGINDTNDTNGIIRGIKGERDLGNDESM